ncbi:VOC family protein [Candidimonas humi]|uniref:VOC family protein n=1 Tax=Candidimonas humi TaxID=683355 RepID=A0ABV8P4A1_9BURK|nr:VOC family protein [Candidimonas humi]
MSTTFGPVRQIGYVVRDIEAAMAQWASIGVGPWFYRKEATATEYRYYGKPSALPVLSFGFANSGDIQIELIAQLNDAPSLYLDTLRQHGEGAQHIAYWTMGHYDEYARTLLNKGYIEGHSGRMGANRGRYAYFMHPQLPCAMIEISESAGGKAELFEEIRAASVEWDGKNPIRRIGPPSAVSTES